MKFKWILSKTFLALILTICQFSYAQPTNNMSLGENLERSLFKAVAAKNWQAVDQAISPEFQSINADKIRNQQEAIAYIKNLQLANYQFSDFSVTQNPLGNILVVTYEMTYAEHAFEHPQAGKKVKNLSVWEKVNGQWQWVAHAVID